MSRAEVVCLVNLLQDVNILRPLVLLAAHELGVPVRLMVSEKFGDRDVSGSWQAELASLCELSGAAQSTYDSPWAALQALAGRRGVLIAASESNLAAHAETHDVFRAAPPAFLKLTLQHGYECVGFLQNRDHSRAHGDSVAFAADVICGWGDLAKMNSVAPSERSKYCHTGPSALLLPPPDAGSAEVPGSGLVCENLHSVRLRTSGDFRAPFMDTFAAFCGELGAQGRHVTMRPHPGGQYVVKHNVALPANVSLDNRPMYAVALGDYAYGLSAPSSVVIDMVLAGLPTAVWQDEDGIVDATHYEGLTRVSTVADWLAFERDVQLRPGLFAPRQATFLQRSGLLTDRRVVRERFLGLIAGGLAAGAARE